MKESFVKIAAETREGRQPIENLKEILQQVTEINERFKEIDKTDEIMDEWKQISRIIDKFFFFFFAILFFVFSSLILGILPLMKTHMDLTGPL